MRALFCHAKSADNVDSMAQEFGRLFAAKLGIPVDEVEVTTARDDFKQYAMIEGGWAGWPRALVSRIDVGTGEPWYDAFILPADRFGKGTAGIVKHALEANRAVLYFANDNLYEARAMVTNDAKDWQNGYEVLPAE